MEHVVDLLNTARLVTRIKGASDNRSHFYFEPGTWRGAHVHGSSACTLLWYARLKSNHHTMQWAITGESRLVVDSNEQAAESG